MTDPKNPRITITPEAYQALCIQIARKSYLRLPGLQNDPHPQAQGAKGSPGER